MNHLLACTLLAPALLAVAAGCGDQIANPIEGSGGSTSSASSGGQGGDAGSTSSSSGGGVEGACTPGCGHDQVCVDGACHALARIDSGAGDTTPCTIVLDDTHVYWGWGSGVQIVPKAGGSSVALGWGMIGTPPALAVDDKYLYFAAGPGTDFHEGMARTKKDGTSFEAFVGEGQLTPKHTVWDGHDLYFIGDAAPPSIYETPTSGVDPMMVPPVFSDDGYGLGALAVDATDVYYWSGNGLVRKDKASHKVTGVYVPGDGLPSLPDDATGIYVDESFAYFSLSPAIGVGGTVSRVSKAGGGKRAVLVDGSSGGSGVFTIDATDLYFMTVSEVMKVPKSGGTPVLVDGLNPPSPFATCMAADDKYIFWVDGSDLIRYTK